MSESFISNVLILLYSGFWRENSSEKITEKKKDNRLFFIQLIENKSIFVCTKIIRSL